MKGGLRVLSGKDVTDILREFGFSVYSTNSSHIKLRRASLGNKETLIIPDHTPIARGTLRAIYLQASRYIPQSELHPHFYNE